jgi:hypothetical protein
VCDLVRILVTTRIGTTCWRSSGWGGSGDDGERVRGEPIPWQCPAPGFAQLILLGPSGWRWVPLPHGTCVDGGGGGVSAGPRGLHGLDHGGITVVKPS